MKVEEFMYILTEINILDNLKKAYLKDRVSRFLKMVENTSVNLKMVNMRDRELIYIQIEESMLGSLKKEGFMALEHYMIKMVKF